MKIGCCGSLQQAPLFKDCGFQYLEGNITQIASMSEKEFQDALDAIKACGMPVLAANCFLPGDWPLAHAKRDPEKDAEYLSIAGRRLHALGCGVAVLGSGGARQLSEDYGTEKGKKQFLDFYEQALEAFSSLGIKIAIEPLRAAECNWLNSIREALSFMQPIERENKGVICDFYHLAQEKESLSILPKAGSLLRHCHIAHPVTRKAPLPGDGGDYEASFRALAEIGFDGCVSLEGDWENSGEVLKNSAAYLKECLYKAGSR